MILNLLQVKWNIQKGDFKLYLWINITFNIIFAKLFWEVDPTKLGNFKIQYLNAVEFWQKVSVPFNGDLLDNLNIIFWPWPPRPIALKYSIQESVLFMECQNSTSFRRYDHLNFQPPYFPILKFGAIHHKVGVLPKAYFCVQGKW